MPLSARSHAACVSNHTKNTVTPAIADRSVGFPSVFFFQKNIFHFKVFLKKFFFDNSLGIFFRFFLIFLFFFFFAFLIREKIGVRGSLPFFFFVF